MTFATKVFKKYFIKLTINDKLLHFETNSLFNFVEEVSIFSKDNGNVVILNVNLVILNDVISSSYHVKCAFQSESSLYSYLNVKQLLTQSRRHI